MNDMPVFGPDQVSTKTALEDIAIETGTPIEVLFAAGEQAGAKSPDEFLSIARQRGQQLGPRFKAGEDPTAIVSEVFGPEAQRSFGAYATEIRAQLYGRPVEQPKPEGGFRKAVGVGVDTIQQGLGSAIEGAGRVAGLEGVEQYGRGVAERNEAEAQEGSRGFTRLGDVEGVGSFGRFASETAGQQVPQMGGTLAAAGAGALAGSFIPGIGTAAGAVIGGLAANIPLFYGQNRERQKDVAEEAGTPVQVDEGAAFLTSLPQAALDVVTDLVSVSGLGIGAKVLAEGGGLLTKRVLVGAGVGAGAGVLMEVPTEIGQTMLERLQAGLPLDTPDAVDEYIEVGVAAGLLGAGLGGVGGGAKAYRERDGIPEDQNAGSDQGAVPPGANPASGPVPPVAPSPAPQGGPTPTSDVLRPQPVDPLDPAGQRPAAPSPVSDMLAGAPQPTLGGFQQGQPVQMQFVDPETGEISDPTPMTFVGEDVAGGYASFRAPDGSPAEVDLSEIASGNLIVSPAGAMQAGSVTAPGGVTTQAQAPAPAQTQAAPMPPIPAGVDPDAFMERVAIRQADGMTPDQAYQMTLQDALEAMREDVGTIADDVEDRQRSERENASRIDEAVFTDRSGEPFIFPTEAAALGRLGEGYTIEPHRGGFIGVRQQEAGNEGNANDGLGGAGGITDGGRVDADRGGDGGAPVATGGDGAALGPVEQGAAQGVADATGAADADAALTDPADQNPVNSEAATDQEVTPDQPETAPADQETDPIRAAGQGVPADLDYPNRKLNMRKARVEAPIDGLGDMNDGSFGSIALSNAREGDVLPGVGTVLKVTDKQVQITKPDGGILRLSDGDKLNRLARDMGGLIASSANLRDEQLGSLMDMIERDPTLTYRDGVPMLFDDPAEQANRGQRSQRGILRPLTPTRQEVEQAAAQADPNPTEGQIEAGNYRKGHLAWNGLDLTIENAKGSERSGTAPDGKTWSVTMPAEYGYFKGTESSDGDHVDFYMGDVPDSDYVLIINQVDPETQAMDEHKAIIGTTARGAALGIYRDGFSDGSGNSRIGSFTETNVANLKAWLASGETKTPTQPIDMPFAKRKAETKAPAPKADAPKRLSVKKQQENRMAKLREYFTPGNIVQSYGGTDRVISFNPEDNGDWTVTVEAVKKQGDEWVKDTADTRVRTHSTNPDARNLKKGPIEKARVVEASAPAQAEPEPTGWRSNKHLSLFKRVYAEPNNSIEDMRNGMFPEVAEYADWLGSLTDAQLDAIAPYFRRDYNPFHGATYLGNGGIADARAEFDPILAGMDGAPAPLVNEQAADDIEAGAALREGRKGLTLGKFAVYDQSGSMISNWEDTPEAARQGARQRLSNRDISAKEKAEKQRRYKDLADRLLAGGDVTDADLRLLDLKERAQWAYISPVVQELFGISNRKVREAMGGAVFKTTSDMGAEYWNARSRDALSNAAQWVNKQSAPAKPTGILSSLSEEKQAEAADLKKRLADKVRNQTSSGLDPEYITLGGRLVALYIEAGTKRFGQMLRDFAETTGLSMREAQAPMRAAYNFTREEMDLDGQDVSDMDSADQVMAEIRKALAEADTPKAEAKPAPKKQKQAPRLLKRPFTTRIKNKTGGIDPDGPLGTELQSRGLTYRNSPGLFKIGGVKDLDNLPASEWQDYMGSMLTDDNGYVSQQWIIDSLEAEARGEPVQDAEQERLQRAMDAKAEEADVAARDADGVEQRQQGRAEDADVGPIQTGPVQFIDEGDRIDAIREEVQDFEKAAGLIMTDQERLIVISRVAINGGNVEDAFFHLIRDMADGGPLDARQEADTDQIPFPIDDPAGADQGSENDAPAGDGIAERPAGDGSGQGTRDAADQDTQRAGEEARSEGDVAPASPTYPTTLEEVAQKPGAGLPRLSHIYAEYRGGRYYLASVPGNPDTATGEWRGTFPDASIFTTDRADGTSISGDMEMLEAAIATQQEAEWWTRTSRENDGQTARDILERAGVGFDRVGRPWRDIRADDQAKILAARNEAVTPPAPTFEPGADGLPQAIMPGMEGGQDQTRAKMTERQRLEFEARQKQSKMRRLGGNDGDAGPLFGNGTDDMFGSSGGGLFDAPQPAAPAPAPAATPDRNDQIEVALSKIETAGRGPEIADEFRRALAADRRALEEWKQEKAKSGGDGSIYNDDIERSERRVVDVEDRILEEAEAIKEPKGEASSATKPAPKSTDKIEDFGEKLAGAKKDLWTSYTDRMAEAEEVNIAAEPLSKSFPAPDYEKLIESGVDSYAVSFVRAAREAIPRKPSKGWKLKGWVSQVETLRKFSNDLLSGRIDKAEVQRRIKENPVLEKSIGGMIALYEAVGHAKSLQGLTFREGKYSVHKGIAYNPPKVLWEVEQPTKASMWSNMGRSLAIGDTREAAVEAFKKFYAQYEPKTKKRSGTKFQIYSYKKGGDQAYRIGVKIGRDWIDLRKGITDVKEARRILAEESDKLQEQLDAMKDIKERRDENAPRMGADHRAGADVTPEQFGEAFGFRGVQFGNYVEGKRRQQDLNDAYDALMDLAGILDIPPKAISLNGSLGLAFGARGSGGKNPAAAHFESDKIVINLTKRSGRGSLAHEWFHAADNYFARKRKEKRGTFITDNSSPGGPLTEGVRPEVIDAFLAVKRAIAATKLKERSSNLDKLRTTPYWGTGIEMHARAFESYIIAKLNDQGASNDYLANIVNGLAWSMQAEMAGLGDSYPYLKADEIDGVREKFDALFNTIQTRETDTGIAMEMRGDTFATDVLSEIAGYDDLFRYPTAQGTTIEAVFDEVDPTIELVGDTSRPDEQSESGADERFLLRTDSGADFYIFQTADEVWINVADLEPGEGGSAIYAAISDYAFNTGRVFIGDPEGLSDAALIRRTDNMLSTAMKHGTTQHIMPHKRQTEGDKSLGVPALRWTAGDDAANLQAMIEVSVANLETDLPEIANARFDFSDGTFRDAKGGLIPYEAIDLWGNRLKGSGRAGGGHNTVKRSIVLSSLLRAASDKRPAILEQVLRQSRQMGQAVAGTFYMRGPVSEPVASLTGQELGEWGDMRQLGRKAEAWYRDNLVGKTVVMEATGWSVKFGRVGSKKLSGRKGDILLRIVPALGKVIQGARLVSTQPGVKPGTEAQTFHKVAATVELGGYLHSIIATLREDANGNYHYDLSMDSGAGAASSGVAGRVAEARSNGADGPDDGSIETSRNSVNGGDGVQQVREARAAVRVSDAQVRSPALEGNPVDINLEFASPEVNTDPAFTEDASRAVTRRLVAEVAKVLPGTKVGVRLVRQLHSLKDSKPIMGRANPDGSIEVSARAARDEAGAVGILNHEIVHVLRNADLWRSPEGLFRGREWSRLVATAEANPDLVAAVNANYRGKGLTREQMQEEYVAEMYRGWKAQTGDYGAVERILLKIEEFFRALASAFRGEGFDSAGMVMQRIADGGIGGRGPDGPGRGVRSGAMQAVPAEMRAGGNPDPIAYPSVVNSLSKLWSRKPATSEASLNAKEGGFVSNLITNAMAMNDTVNILGLVPGEVLFRDLGKNLPSAGKWVNTVRKMNSERQEMHAGSDRLAREWLQIFSKDKKNGRALHDLMHESTIEQVDPSERFRAPRKPLDMTDAQYINFVEERRNKHAELKQKFNSLPEAMQDVYRRVRDSYKEFDTMLIDAQVDAVVKAMGLQADRLKARYEGELQQFKDDGLEGDALKEAQKKARSRFNQDVKMLEFSRNARIRKMRLTYEANRIEGPYFPLMRFGQFFVEARDNKGKLVHFERASTAGAMNRIEAEMKDAGFVVKKGVMKPDESLSRFVDPNFVADITEAMGEAGADSQILDAIYQRYLETLPSFSIRKANIHRQGTPGYDKDAIKAFGSRMFHGAHQLTRLRHSMDLTKYIENAAREAKTQPDPTRAMAITNEMKKRHDWTMNPSGSSLSAWATSAMFVWYLGLTPAAAVTNVSQTTVVGIPIMAASIEGGTVVKASKHLLGALSDFTAGLKKGDAEWSRGALTSGRLNAEERKALQEAYNSGALDKSEGHDIAAIGDGGAEYSPIRERAMRPIAFLFHHAERLNREVTFLAAYRMAKEAGMEQEAAWRKAVDITWDTHFNYENWSRPRFMQHDAARVIFTFKQFQVNMLYRLFRDSHQALKSESPEVRKQARAQLIGITASMMLHAGITGTWGYALIMLLAGMFFEGGSDEAEEELKDAIVSTFGAGAGGLLLKGVPGHLTGTDMTSRMGMPELWFRSPNRQLEGSDAYNHWVSQLLGPAGGIAENMFRGVELLGDGEVWRGAELMVPKAIRDQLRFVRYLNEGVTTYKGDPLLDDISAHDAIVQAIGFSPARVSERYEQNRRLMNAQVRIEDERRKILSDITRYIREGKDISPRALRRRDEFNAKYPLFQIDAETIQRSYKARQRMSEQMDGGVRINPKLDRYLRDNMAPSISQ